MKAHQYNNATSADLWAALGDAAHRNVAAVAAGFTEQPGVPLVEVTRSCVGGKGTLTLTEDRFTINDPHPQKLTWTIPVTLGAPGTKPVRVLLTGAPATVKLASCTAPMKANLGEDGYFRTQYDDASLQPLMANFGKLAATDRANLLGDQFALFQAGRAPLSGYLDLLGQLKGETNIAVWKDTLSHLTRLDDLTRGSNARPAFRAFVIKLLRPEFARIGWDAKPGESFLDTLLRPDLIAALGEAGDPEITAEAKRRFDKFVTMPDSLAPNLREPVVMIVGHHADPATYDRLRKLGETATSTEEKLRYFGAMAVAEDPALVARTVEYAASGQVPNGRVAMLIAYAGRGSDNPDLVFKLVQAQQAKIRTHLAETSQNFLLPAAAFASSNPEVAKALLADPATKGSKGAQIIGAMAADSITTTADLHAKTVAQMEAWLKAQKG
jgi:aminopeptidase N